MTPECPFCTSSAVVPAGRNIWFCNQCTEHFDDQGEVILDRDKPAAIDEERGLHMAGLALTSDIRVQLELTVRSLWLIVSGLQLVVHIRIYMSR